MSPIAAKRSSFRGSRGHTLVEMLTGVSIAVVVLGGMVSAYVYFGHVFTRMAHQQQLEQSTRRAFAAFAADAAQANRVTSLSNTTNNNSLVLSGIPLAASEALYPGTRTVTYAFNGTVLTRAETIIPNVGVPSSSPTVTLLGSSASTNANRVAISTFSFGAYSAGNVPTTLPLGIKRVDFQVEVTAGSAPNKTQAAYAAASHRVSLRNGGLLQ